MSAAATEQNNGDIAVEKVAVSEEAAQVKEDLKKAVVDDAPAAPAVAADNGTTEKDAETNDKKQESTSPNPDKEKSPAAEVKQATKRWGDISGLKPRDIESKRAKKDKNSDSDSDDEEVLEEIIDSELESEEDYEIPYEEDFEPEDDDDDDDGSGSDDLA